MVLENGMYDNDDNESDLAGLTRVIQGEEVVEEREVSHGFYLTYASDRQARDTGDLSTDIYMSSPDSIPIRKNETVQRLCTIKWTKNIPLRSLRKWKNPVGKTYRRLHHKIEMKCEDGIMGWTVWYKGKAVGSKDVEVQYD
jgi:hypothetical protein